MEGYALIQLLFRILNHDGRVKVTKHTMKMGGLMNKVVRLCVFLFEEIFSYAFHLEGNSWGGYRWCDTCWEVAIQEISNIDVSESWLERKWNESESNSKLQNFRMSSPLSMLF